MNKNHREIEDDILDKVSGKINFKEKKSKQFLRLFVKGVAFLAVAAISGGMAGSYNSSKKTPIYIYPPTNNSPGTISSIISPISEYGIITKNDIIRVAETISPSIVGVHLETLSQRVSNGIIFKAEGYIITSYSNIKDKDKGKIMVMLQNNDNKQVADLLGFNEVSDIAVIKIQGKNFPTAKFGDATKVNVGEIVVALGNPLAKQQVFGTITHGILSTLNKSIEVQDSITKSKTTYNLFLTDAVINQGNSGGPLCNLSGEVIGINSLKIANYEGKIDGLSFSLSMSSIREIIDNIMNVGRVSKAQIGIKAIKAVLEDETIKGAYVQDVVTGTGSDAAGIKPTDIIIEVDNQKISNVEDLNSIISKRKVGDKVHIKIWRNMKIIDKDIQLSEQQDNNS
ncbi:MAG: trypsin-like peptidase domain-containing protein [Clostridiaceae bacterium]|nr:trypsin-like peptidase domain-containing protein [Clostridiaceae bacterium]